MECVSCKSKKFYKNDSGYYICLVCYSQSGPILKHENFSVTPKSMKRKLNIVNKYKEHTVSSNIPIGLSWNEYKNSYASLVTYCITNLCQAQNLKQELIPYCKSLLDYFIPETHPDTVLPKNRRKRLKSSLHNYPKNNLGISQKLISTYGELSEEKINKLYETLTTQNPKLQKKSKKLDKLFNALDPNTELLSSELPINLGTVLVIIYIALLYAYSDSKGILVGDVIDWTYSGALPYLKAYKFLDLPKPFQSLYKPLSIPSASWIRKQVAKAKIDSTSTFRSYYPFISNLFTVICAKLSLVPTIAEIGLKLYLRAAKHAVSFMNSNALPETVVAAHIIIVLKLIYGLNDCSYLIDLQKSKTHFVRKSVKLENSEIKGIGKIIATLPSVSDVFETWQRLLCTLAATNQYYTVASVEKVLGFVQSCGMGVDEELVVDQATEKEKHGLDVQQRMLAKNAGLLAEFQYYKKKGEFKVPAQDYWVQKKKDREKEYPFDYLFTVHCVCALGGGLGCQEVNYVCDRIDRWMAKMDIN